MTDFSDLSECFSGELTISTISERHAAAKSLLVQEKPILIDLSSINKIDISGIQLLISAEKHIKKSAINTKLINKNQYTTDSMQVCGIVG